MDLCGGTFIAIVLLIVKSLMKSIRHEKDTYWSNRRLIGPNRTDFYNYSRTLSIIYNTRAANT